MTLSFSAVEILPDGRERILARGLTLAEVQTYVPSTPWAITFRQES